MSVGTDPEQLQIDASGVTYLCLVPVAGEDDVVGCSVRHVDVARIDVDEAGEVLLDEDSVRRWMAEGQTDVFVEKEGGHLAKRQSGVAATAHQLVVEGQGRAAGRQPQHGVWPPGDQTVDDVRAEHRDGGGIRLYHDLHRGL